MADKDTLAHMMFEQVFRENRKMLENLAYFYVRDYEAAKDIVSQSFMNLWEKRDTLADDRLLGYMFTTVKNSCLNYRRDATIHKAVYERISQKERRMMEHYSNAIESCNPSDLFARDILAICSQQLASMPAETREIYINSRIKGLSYKEIAELMGISVKRVDHQIQKVLSSLRISLKDFLDFIIIMITLHIHSILS